MFGTCAVGPAYAVCVKGKGDTEIQCVANGAAGAHQSLSVSSVFEVPVSVLVTQWVGKCGRPDTFIRADSRTVPAKTAAAIPFVPLTGKQCSSAVFSECKYTEITGTKAGSAQVPLFCGELLDVKEAAK